MYSVLCITIIDEVIRPSRLLQKMIFVKLVNKHLVYYGTRMSIVLAKSVKGLCLELNQFNVLFLKDFY
jgi:hypothetical protein